MASGCQQVTFTCGQQPRILTIFKIHNLFPLWQKKRALTFFKKLASQHGGPIICPKILGISTEMIKARGLITSNFHSDQKMSFDNFSKKLERWSRPWTYPLSSKRITDVLPWSNSRKKRYMVLPWSSRLSLSLSLPDRNLFSAPLTEPLSVWL